MAVEALLVLPEWVFVGVVVGVLMSAGVAATFLVASRLFPDDDYRRGSWRSTEKRRRAEIRRYLDAIGERFAEDAVVAGETVAFYLPRRNVAVTFDARTYLELEGMPTTGVLMEHEMPGIALGHRLPFETPSVSVGETDGDGTDTARTDPDWGGRNAGATDAAFAVLGLSRSASDDAVQRAYRERVKEVHPDQGGTESEFRRVREAYDTARRNAS